MEKYVGGYETRSRRKVTRSELVLGAIVLFLLVKLYAPATLKDQGGFGDRDEDEYFTCHAPLPSLLTTREVDRTAFEADIQWTESLLKGLIAGTNGYGEPADAVSVSIFLPTGAPIYEAGFGRLRANESGESTVDGDSIYRMASVTKMFTTAQLMLQKQKGQLGLDEDVSTILDDFKPTNKGWTSVGENRTITIRQLLSHMSGLTRDAPWHLSWPISPNISVDAGAAPTRAEEMEAVRKIPLVMSSYMTPVYSNIAFDIAGWVAQEIASVSYTDLIYRDIFQPLRMPFSSFSVTPSNIERFVVPGKPNSDWADVDMNDTNPCGGMYSSASDLRRFGQKLLNPTSKPDADSEDEGQGLFLSKQSIGEWIKPLYAFDDGLTSVGLSWEIFRVPFGQRRMSLYTKSGNIPGFHTMFGIDREREFGLSVLVSGQPTNTTALSIRIAKRFAETLDQEREKILAKEYAGVYRNGNASVAQLQMRDGTLALTRAIFDGLDLFEAFHLGEGDGGAVALWPTAEPGVFRLALGRPPTQPFLGCLLKFASMDGIYADDYPLDLIILDGERLIMKAANATLAKQHSGIHRYSL